MSITAAIKRPFSAKALPGLLLILLPIIEFFAMGYKMLCARTAMSQNYNLPEWKNWKELFVFGAVARAVQAIWLTPAAIVFLLLYFKLKILATGATASLKLLMSINDMTLLFLACLLFAAIFMPASVMNYVAEARFRDAFSFSMLKRMLSKNYLIGWLASGAYTILIAGIFFGSLVLIGTFTSTWPSIAIAAVILPVEVILLWLLGITYWTISGEYWGKSIYREYRVTR